MVTNPETAVLIKTKDGVQVYNQGSQNVALFCV
jgi:hypothetical protein